MLPEIWNAEVERCFYITFNNHRDVMPCEANRHLLSDYLDRNLLPCTPVNLETALTAVFDGLAKTAVPVVVPKPTPPVEATPEVTETDAERVLREQKEMKSSSPKDLRAKLNEQRRVFKNPAPRDGEKAPWGSPLTFTQMQEMTAATFRSYNQSPKWGAQFQQEVLDCQVNRETR
jgi:hypothetical protein